MNISEHDLEGSIQRFGERRRAVLRKALAGLDARHVHLPLALAIGSRETNLQNIVGDAGHGRGVFQQDDRFQQVFLRSTPGCIDGTYQVVFPSALESGRVPTLTAGLLRMTEIIVSNFNFATSHGVPKGHRLRFAVAAYNAGPGGALSGFQQHGDADRFTAGGDYSADVFARRDAIAEMGL